MVLDPKKIAGRALFSFGLFILLFNLTFASQGKQETQKKKSRWMEMGGIVDVSEIDPAQYSIFTDWLDKNAKTPIDYAVEKCKNHQIVIFGEAHGVKDCLDFFNQLIPAAYHEAGVTYVVLEVCSVETNDKIAKLVESEAYDKNLALEIARSEAWGTWGLKEYWDIFETVWKLNKSLGKDQEHMKVIGMDIDVDLQLDWLLENNKLQDKVLIEKAEKQNPLIVARDPLMAAAIEMFVIRKGAKGIVLVGANHAFTHYAQPGVNKEGIVRTEWPRMAYLLYKDYKEKIFQIDLHRFHESPAIIFPDYKGGNPVFTSFIEDIMANRGNKSVGFDVFCSPFANIRDGKSYYFHFQPNVTFKDISRGFIYIKPVKELSRCTWMENYISDEMFEKSKFYYEVRFNRKFKNAKEVNEFFSKY